MSEIGLSAADANRSAPRRIDRSMFGSASLSAGMLGESPTDDSGADSASPLPPIEAVGVAEAPTANAAERPEDGAAQLERQRLIEELEARDAEVRQHEAAHLAAAGGHARGSARYTFETGPDGKRYATGGQVQVDTSPVRGDPRATIEKARQIRRAALAPAEPSSKDRAVAARASAMERRAQEEIAERRGADAADAQLASFDATPTRASDDRMRHAYRPVEVPDPGVTSQSAPTTSESVTVQRVSRRATVGYDLQHMVPAGLDLDQGVMNQRTSFEAPPERSSVVVERVRSYEAMASAPSTGTLGCGCGTVH